MSNVKYYFEPDGRFTIEDFNHAKPFSSFLPGIAGKKGIPIWAFYVNRGQCMAGFGVRNKDGAIQEFIPADKSPWYTSWRGFRTFIKIKRPDGPVLYEPFRIDGDTHFIVRTKLSISAADFTISEINEDLNLETRVTYFTLPEEKIGGLYRKTELINLGNQPIHLEIVDGLAVIIPAGVSNFTTKNMGALIRAWMKTGTDSGIPFYRLAYLADDVPELHTVDYVNFYYGYTIRNQMAEPLNVIYDPSQIFGLGTDYQPIAFAKPDFQYREDQIKENYWPSAFSYAEIELGATGQLGASANFYGLFGRGPNENYVKDFLSNVDARYYDTRFAINRDLIEGIEDYAFTNSGNHEFDRYIGHSLLDNIIRGGLPVTLTGENSSSPKVFWLYSRKHGDPEREYNEFELSPSFFSQGNGNFRDINQNRRNDIWFNTDVRDASLRFFWNLIQLDGYNPLVVKGFSYDCRDVKNIETLISGYLADNDALRERLLDFLKNPFTPGELYVLLEEELQLLPEKIDDVFNTLIQNAQGAQSAVHGEGYWCDHWVYNLDLLESFLSIYPDKLVEACIERHDYCFYDNDVVLAPFQERYQLINGAAHPKNCIRTDTEKNELIMARKENHHLVRTGGGERVYFTNLVEKMLVLALNKLASFDPFVTGLEMDASRPGWCDALNGLPGIFGSSVSEVFSLQRLLKLLEQILGAAPKSQKFVFPVEVVDFMNRLAECLRESPLSEPELYGFWLASHTIRDEYLQKVRFGLEGKEEERDASALLNFIFRGLVLTEHALTRAYQPQNELYTTYFYYKVTRFRVLGEKVGQEKPEIFVLPEEFTQYLVPEFLEGQVYALRYITDVELAGRFHKAVRQSPLFDRKLQMYKVCADLTKAPPELGRIRVFPRGWLENESIFLHMEYKYLLEVLRSGLYKEFFQELPQLLVCFANPEIYGRNPLENSTFIVSSAYPQPEWHGNGFVARMSGSNAELINIWLLMSFGERPFRINQSGELTLQFAPVLSGELFTGEAKEMEILWPNGVKKSYTLPAASFTAKFLGKTLVVYNNPEHKATFGTGAAQVVTLALSGWDGQSWVVKGKEITGELAEKARMGLLERIDVLLS